MQEIWKPIPGYEGLYEASNLGAVRSLHVFLPVRKSRTMPAHTRLRPGRTLVQRVARRGYLNVTLSKGSKATQYFSHRLIALTFHGEPPVPKAEVNHMDGCRSNNCATNLEWTTGKGNMAHAVETGLQPIPRGEKNGQSKLTEEQIVRIRELLKSGLFQREIGAMFGVAQGTISQIKSGNRWACVPI